jgi:uncharacterized protein
MAANADEPEQHPDDSLGPYVGGFHCAWPDAGLGWCKTFVGRYVSLASRPTLVCLCFPCSNRDHITAVYLNAAMGAPVPPASVFAASELLLLIPSFAITTLIAGPFTEEPAWRGFYLPRLQAKYSAMVSSLIVGVIWWSWHLPLMVSDPMGQRPPLQFLALTLAFSIIYTWIYNNAKASLFLIAVVHGVTNTFAGFLFPSQFGEDYLRLWWLYAGIWWIVALVVVIR